MKIELTTISTKKFLLITLLSTLFILFFSIGLAILTNVQWIIFLVIPLLGLTIYIGQRLAKTAMKIDLNEDEYLKIDNQKIEYKNIIGYFINDTGLTQTAICLRLKSEKTIQITGVSIGEQGKVFQKAQDEIIRILKRKNSQLLELEYQDVYVQQANILRPILYLLTGTVVIIDFVAVYFLISGKMDLPWQIFFVNALFIWLIPYMKK